MAFTKTNTAVASNNTNVKYNEAAFRAQVQAALNHISTHHRRDTLTHLRDLMLARHYALHLPTHAHRTAALAGVHRIAAKRMAATNLKRDTMRSTLIAKARQHRQEAVRRAMVLKKTAEVLARRVPVILEQRRLEQDINATRGSREGNPIVVADDADGC
ncbi:hypothetical protein LTR56_022943 [Elasticomyces elasticus]|nr:hypothetical protein LTR56_022943 [Elasticomyces elasticus]KAK3626974.1 hypothetical protein LTR22_022931 [Elasticomyces elasticus]KAK4910817.1 hypothetical protein LTR49_020512 [Elasticomyces elasticus]KAK5750394.1 hypothetical protein LTS12_019502 [Elasticomyces elasticus]